MRPEEEGNSNRDCRALALAEAGFDFEPDTVTRPSVRASGTASATVTDAVNDGEAGGEALSAQVGDTNSAEIYPESSCQTREFSRSHWSRRSRRGRRCSHNRHRRRNDGRRGLKQRECNFAAAVCSMLAVVSLCTSLAEPRWFRLIGGGCNVRTLGVGQFFSFGSFESHSTSNMEYTRCKIRSHYIYFPNDDCATALVDCVNMEAVQVLKVIIVLCFLGALLSLAAFLLDLVGPVSPVLKATRRHAVCSLLTVFCSVVIVGLCYWVSEIIAMIQHDTYTHGNVISVQFDVSFYLITAAGAISVIGSAFNLLKKHPIDESQDLQRLLEEYDNSSSEPAPLRPDYYAPMLNIPPPPAYSP